MKSIKILGTGCPKCGKLAESANQAAEELGIEYKLEKITDITEITNYGIMMTPALVIDGIVKAVGKVPPVNDIKKMLE